MKRKTIQSPIWHALNVIEINWRCNMPADFALFLVENYTTFKSLVESMNLWLCRLRNTRSPFRISNSQIHFFFWPIHQIVCWVWAEFVYKVQQYFQFIALILCVNASSCIIHQTMISCWVYNNNRTVRQPRYAWFRIQRKKKNLPKSLYWHYL